MEKTTNYLIGIFNNVIKYVKTNKKISFIVLLVFIVLIILMLSGGKKTGNSNSNLSNLGFTINVKNTLYYSDYSYENKGIYKAEGKEFKKISNGSGYYLNESGGYIYFIDALDNNIVKINKNGKNKTIIVENVDNNKMVVSGKWIYYFEDSYLYRVKTNGKDKKRLSEKQIEEYQVFENQVYYSYVDNLNYTIAKMKCDGENNHIISEECGSSFYVSKNAIYFVKYAVNNNEYELYKMKLNGKNKTKIASIKGALNERTINFTDSEMFYTKMDEENNLAIYTIGLKNKKEKKIVNINGFSTNININGKWIYYPDENENGDFKIFKIRADGKGDKYTL